MGVWNDIGIVLGGAVLLFLLLAYAAYRKAFYATRRQKMAIQPFPLSGKAKEKQELVDGLMREMEALPVEEVTVTAHDGTVLVGHYYEADPKAPLYIQFHGYRGSALRDFCGGNRLARELGGNTLVVDQRAHGKSGGHTITFGIRERLDCLCWIEYARKRFGAAHPIYLTGVSMGAATVLMAAGEELPDNVYGVLADCPYSSPGAIIRKVCGEMGFPPSLAYPLVCFGGWFYGGFRLWRYSVTEAVARARVPVFLVHGAEDTFVPTEMSREILAACAAPKKQLEIFPDAAHGLSYVMDQERYTALARRFTEECAAMHGAERPTAAETKSKEAPLPSYP